MEDDREWVGSFAKKMLGDLEAEKSPTAGISMDWEDEDWVDGDDDDDEDFHLLLSSAVCVHRLKQIFLVVCIVFARSVLHAFSFRILWCVRRCIRCTRVQESDCARFRGIAGLDVEGFGS